MFYLNILRNTFQVALIQGQTPQDLKQHNFSTFAIFLYQSVSINGQMLSGIFHPFLGFQSLPVDLLLGNSNVGQPGKSGTLGPPMCQQECEPGTWGLDCASRCNCFNSIPCDFASGMCPGGLCATGKFNSIIKLKINIFKGFTGKNCAEDVDECSLHLHKCSANATCTNTPPGSYTCTCNAPTFSGNGFNCTMFDPCKRRFNEHCHVNAHCDASNEEIPECICNEGFHGDGRRLCSPNVETSTSVITTTTQITTTLPTLETTKQTSIETTQQTTKIKTNINIYEKHHLITSTNVVEKVNNNEERIKTFKDVKVGMSDNELLAAANDSGTLILVVCSILGSTWLIIAVVFSLIYCFKRQRLRQVEYNGGPQMLGWTPKRGIINNNTLSTCNRGINRLNRFNTNNFATTKFG
uniref:EGF-like domain-containing protein n=1 Tax=Meloidogyne hapla TaxID=6305 RepID=A0A1I8BRL4_MELHA